MRKFNIALTLTVGALALAACGGKEEAAKTAAAQADVPSRAAGLWEQTVELKGQPPQVSKICLGEGQDAKDFAAAPAHCKPTVKKVSNGWSIDTVCEIEGAGKSESKTLITGDMAREIVSKTTAVTTVKGAPGQNTEVSMTARRLGDCPPDMPVGAVEQNGVIIDSSQLKK